MTPVIFTASVYIAVLLLTRFLPLEQWVSFTGWMVIALFYWCVAVVFFFCRRSRLALFTVGLLLVCLFCLRLQLRSRYISRDARQYAGQCTYFEGRIISRPVLRQKTLRLEMDLSRLAFRKNAAVRPADCITVNGRAMVYLEYTGVLRQYHIDRGDRLKIYETLHRVRDKPFVPGFNYARYLHDRGVYLTSRVQAADVADLLPARGYQRWLNRMRRYVTGTFDAVLGDREAAFMKSLLVADRDDLDEDVVNQFRKSGTIHVLALSGLHMGILAGLSAFLLGLFPLPERARYIIPIPILIVFTLLVGGGTSILRACLMTCTGFLVLALRREMNIVNIIALAALLILLWMPTALFSVGFQLSFGATLSIVLFYTPISDWLQKLKIPRCIYSLFSASTAAQMATIPVILSSFGTVSLISFAANMIIVPLIGIIVPYGVIILVCHAINGVLGPLAAFPLLYLLKFTFLCSKFFAGVPYAVLNFESTPVFLLSLYVSVLAILAIYRYRKAHM